MDYQVLGPLRVMDGARPVEIRGDRAARLLGLLLAHPDGHVTEDVVVDVLWPAGPPQHPRRSIDALLRRLGRAVPPGAVAWEPAGLGLRVPSERVDARRFERAAATALAAPGRAGAAIAEALILWRGDPYPELDAHPVVLAEVRRLEDLHLRLLEEGTGLRLAGPVDYELVADLEELTARHPERERLWRQLALALYRIGRQVEALRAFTRCREAFGSDEVLSDTSVRLERAIARQDPALADGEPEYGH